MKCRIAKKISRHFWSRYLDPNNPRHKVSTVRKAVRIYNRQLKVKVKLEHNLPKFDWMDEVSPPDPYKLFGLRVGPMTASINGKMLGLVVPNFDYTIPGEKKEGDSK